MQAALFETLKHGLKQRGLTYAVLAQRLGLSEPTLKRLFAEQNCKLDRLLEICAAADIDFASVVSSASRPPPEPKYLPPEIEAALARDISLAMVLFFLTEGFTPETIAQTNGISQASCFLYLRDLERLGLVRLDRDTKVAFLVPLPIAYRRNGPMMPLIRRINQNFVGHVLKTADEGSMFESLSRRMRPATYALLRRETEALARRARELSHHDKMTTPDAELIGCKWTALMAEAPFKHILTVVQHPREKRGTASEAKRRAVPAS
jgi:transcriptional regulator with XRE-family HTH domain